MGFRKKAGAVLNSIYEQVASHPVIKSTTKKRAGSAEAAGDHHAPLRSSDAAVQGQGAISGETATPHTENS
jgi:hypothetical protein